jgi:hypothetical protein
MGINYDEGVEAVKAYKTGIGIKTLKNRYLQQKTARNPFSHKNGKHILFSKLNSAEKLLSFD